MQIALSWVPACTAPAGTHSSAAAEEALPAAASSSAAHMSLLAGCSTGTLAGDDLLEFLLISCLCC